jgi:signal transduction histidine kinase
MRRLLIDGKEISGGNMDYHVDTAKMPQPMKEHGEQLNSITEGLNKAVNERMKSERFRTELITNVSHDIKTPLTSIINYVDLLEKENISEEKAREYIEVLSRQSAKLKKLIEDLMEASKASTGNLAVNLERCELNVLMDQCTGEYAEKLKAANLELLVTKPDEPITVMADGRHMWRIFDNLLGNICKYAMPGTRVYLNLERQSAQAVVTLRNISASRLNLGEDELLERFVRGDSSRNTEGSGLGLSIANSLVRLQNGTMDLTVDGDLFKVTLKFNTVE